MSFIDTVIVGAGPYGLSIAAHLRKAGVNFEILGSALDSWRLFMPAGMYLKSESFASNLWDPERKFTLERYCTEKGIAYQAIGKPLSIKLFLEYADWFRQQAVGDIRDVRVDRLSRGGRGFILNLTDGSSIEAARVILATGHMAFRFVPPEFSQLPEPLCVHTTHLGDVAQYAGRDVTVIGAGQSALESAALLSEAGATVRVLATDAQVFWNDVPNAHPSLIDQVLRPPAGLGSGWKTLAVCEFPRLFRWIYNAKERQRKVHDTFGPAGAWWMRDRVEGKFDVLLQRRVRAAQRAGDRVRLTVEGPSGASEVLTDHVVVGTGFKVDLRRLDYLDPALRSSIALEENELKLDANFETSVPGLFVVGVASAPTFGPVMRFMFGAKHAGSILARRLRHPTSVEHTSQESASATAAN